MNKLSTIFFASFALAACTGTPHPAISAEDPNILILGEDSDPDSVPRNNRIFKRVLNAVSNQLSDEGFNVYDETAVTLDDFVQGRSRRTDAEIIDIARSIKRPPIDVGVIFSIYGTHKKLTYTAKVKTRIEGRLLNVKTGQRLGNFEVDMPEAENVPRDCNRDCLLEEVGKQSKELAQDLGAVLATKLAHIVDKGGYSESNLPTGYALVFSNFKVHEISAIEEYLTTFSGYKKHRPVKSSMRTAEYWYETDSKSARLNRNLRKMLDHLDVKGRVTFGGNEFKVEKITLRSK